MNLERAGLGRVTIIGLGLGEPDVVAAHPGLAGADAVIAGRSILERLASLPARKIPVTADVAGLLTETAALLDQGNHVAVLATGDPLFFGIGATFAEHFGREWAESGRLCVYPGISSLQTAAARLGLPWAQITAVSAHGRESLLPLAHAVLRGGPVCLLTDKRNTPARAARFLLERGVTQYAARVFTNLGKTEGADAESVWSGSLAAAAAQTFPDPNVLFLLPDASLLAPLPLCPGQPESAFARERSIITKWPVRAAALAALRIEPRHTVWDLGAGAGSVAIEAASLARAGLVVAVEKNADRVRHIEENRRRFGAANVTVVQAATPECLRAPLSADLPAPDRIFIGGGLGGGDGEAAESLHLAWEHLAPGGRLVLSCVLLSVLEKARAELATLGAKMEITLIQASVSESLGNDMRLAALNPVFLLSGQK